MTTYCSKCGEKNEDDAKFCRKCGMSLNSKIMKVNNEENDNTKKYIIIGLIVVLACLLIVAGTFFVLNQHNMKSQDFGAYIMNVPANANFDNNSTANGLSTFVDSGNHLMTAYIYTNTLTGAVGAAAVRSSFDSYPTVTSDKLTVGNCTIHKISSGEDYGYVALYNPTGIYIVVASDNLDDLVQMVNSIQIKATTTNSTSTSTNSGSSSSSSGSSDSSGVHAVSETTVNINGNDYDRIYYSDGSYKTYGTVSGKLYQNTHDDEPTNAVVYDHPI
jgi:hypothetical protein